MGCDIHPHFEVKINGEWKYYGEGDFDRNYNLFAKLAGVRNYNEIEKIDDPRGLPEDITEMTKIHNDFWNDNVHSHSWISSEEYVKVFEFIDEMLKKEDYHYNFDHIYLFGNSFHNFHKYREDYPEFLEDFRMVFWFDD